MTEAVQQQLITAVQIIAGSLVTAYVTIHSANKKTEESAHETNQLVKSNTAETSKKLEQVHETVNGNYTALQAKYDAQVVENQLLREQIAQRAAKRATDP